MRSSLDHRAVGAAARALMSLQKDTGELPAKGNGALAGLQHVQANGLDQPLILCIYFTPEALVWLDHNSQMILLFILD